MKKTFLTMIVGALAGYQIGFQDAQVHKDTVLTRFVAFATGDSRDHYRNDIDATMDRLEKR